jgi:hypothetical protein
MELQDAACCGIFELCDIGDNVENEVYNEETGEYELKTWRKDSVDRKKAIAACAGAIREHLDDIHPRGRLVFATTIPGMNIEVAALRSLRFRVTRRFRNGNTGSRITMWTKYVR